jgi:hypothetical protein
LRETGSGKHSLDQIRGFACRGSQAPRIETGRGGPPSAQLLYSVESAFFDPLGPDGDQRHLMRAKKGKHPHPIPLRREILGVRQAVGLAGVLD